jgi:hypothetical protein
VIDIIANGAATSTVLSHGWAGEAAVARRTVPPVHKAEGTGVPTASFGTRVAMGADLVQGEVARVRAVTDQGIPPRRGPDRC